MAQHGTLRDFMLIARDTTGDDGFHDHIRQALQVAAMNCKDITPRADFAVGLSEHVEVFSAPDMGAARSVCALVNEVCGVRAELAPLRKGW
jgi:hypothetical protein